MIQPSSCYNNQKQPSQLYDQLLQKEGRLCRIVASIKNAPSRTAKISQIFLLVIAGIVLCLTIIGIYPLKKIYRTWKKWSAYDRYFLDLQTKQQPNIHSTAIKSKLFTFNHLFQFTISQQHLWYRQYHHRIWKPFYFDGFEIGRIPIEMDCDGANLVIIDDKRKVHYKKVIKEWRENGKYHWSNKVEKDNWKDKWFSLPYLSYPYNLIFGSRLELPKNQSWGISHRGQWVHYFEDLIGKKHFDDTGTTCLYLIDQSGRSISYADPWLPFGFIWKINLPTSTDHTEWSMSVGASTIMLMEKESKNNVPHIYTRLADFDTLGFNPLNRYSYDPSNCRAATIFLPPEDWRKQPVIQNPSELQYTGHITIFQSGTGNSSRELRVQVIDQKQQKAYYTKNIFDNQTSNWKLVLE